MKSKAHYKRRCKALRALIRHAWVHAAYPDCGFMQMTTDQKRLYCKVVGGEVNTRVEIHRRGNK